jgi:2-dehydro-3-deoxygluconokinase
MSSSPVSVVTVGEGLVCLAPRGTQSLSEATMLEKTYGGAELNTAIGLSRLGITTQWVSRVGADSFGEEMLGVLAREGVRTDYVRTIPGRVTGLMVKERISAEEIAVGYYRAESATATMSPEDLPVELIAGARVVHLTGIGLALGGGPEATTRGALELCRAGNAICTFDPNYRRQLWSPEDARAAYATVMPAIDHLLCNEHEVQLITGIADVAEAASALSAQGPSTVIVKQGARGAFALIDGTEYYVPPAPVSAAVDTVGAGDAFNAGWIFGVLSSMSPLESLNVAAWAAARVVEHSGDYAGFPDHEMLTAGLGTPPLTVQVGP